MKSEKPGRCLRCMAPTSYQFDGKYICEECFAIAGSCCVGELEVGIKDKQECDEVGSESM